MTSKDAAGGRQHSSLFQQRLIESGTETGALIAAHDWSASIGPIETWPQSLKTMTLFVVRAGVPSVMLWGDKGILIYNDAYARFSGGRHPALLGAEVRKGWPEIADFNDHIMKVVMTGRTLHYPDQLLVLDRHGAPEDVWLDLDYSPVMDDDGLPNGVLCLVTEITARVTAEKAAAEAERAAAVKSAEQADILNQLAEGVIVADRDGQLVFINAAAEALHGVKMLGVAPEAYADTYHLLTEDGAPYPFKDLPLARAVLSGETIADARWRIVRPDGSEVLAIGTAKPLLSDDGERLGSVLTVRNDTERAASEALTKASEARFRNMADHAPVMLWVTEPDGTCTYLSRAWYEFTGQTFEQGLGLGWLDAVHPDDRGWSGDVFLAANARRESFRLEYRLRCHTGEYHWAIDAAAPRFADDGAFLGFVGSVIDIHDRRTAEADLRELNETLERRIAEALAERAQIEDALRQSQKMEAVGQLTGGIAHDFNNMLAVVIGSLDLLIRRQGDADPRAKRYVNAAMEGARRAATLTQRLLAFARQQPLRPEPIDANRLVADMSELLLHSLGGHIQLETVLAGGLWRTHADPNQLENVILNLAVNGRDAMPGGGKLTIETRNTHLDERYAATHLGVAPGQYAMIAVTDTGTGMPEEVIAKAFDPFFTTKEVGKGTGLGLSQVYGFVKQSGGHVKIYSEPDVGTSVKIYLPRLLGAADAPEGMSSSDDMAMGEHKEVVLVVEDEAVVRQFSVDALTELGYRVFEADGAVAALNLLDRQPEISLLFTDVVMPEINGAKLAEEARRRRPDLRVLFTTGYTRNAVVHNGTLDPGVELIGKPFTIEELAEKVREVLDRA